MNKKMGERTIVFSDPVYIKAAASSVGPKEGEGPLSDMFDEVKEDILCGEASWEKAESRLVELTIKLAAEKAGLPMSKIDFILAGDLLNQSMGSTFGIRNSDRPFLGLFAACSTIGLGMTLGAMLIDGGFADNVIANASSHFCAAEKQFRFPLELGSQRPLSSTWTVTGDGAVLLSRDGGGPCMTSVTPGKIMDLGVTDVNNMGAAMAPAAADTIMNHLKDTGREPGYYDVIATGDLGYVGGELCAELLRKAGYDLGKAYTDCGILIFDREKQDTHSGGSGCACSAVTFCGYFYKKLMNKEIRRMLFVPTGALLSPTSAQQGETIPGIAHAVAVEG